ncbi:MAG: SpoIIE family protein phosphatase [Bacilli bacterium]|nr:SpoIIE family protein phosphatase [Bacilli bacterium]MBR1581988.1 SpoIIE family protein phosphatase [Bacilli bacterium]
MKKSIQIDTLEKNEHDANKQMVKVSVFSAIVLTIIYILYLTKVFPIRSLLLVNIFFPYNIVMMLSTLIWQKTKFFNKPGMKYFLLFIFMTVIATVNVAMPKHAMIGWAACIVLANHYYSPKVGRVIFFTSLITMLICIYAGMFFGEYDLNLFNGAKIVYDEEAGRNILVELNTFEERVAFLNEKVQQGDNRYIKVFVYYYLARAIFLTVVFFITDALNKRTFKLLSDEINLSNNHSRIETELSIAEEIQRSALPDEFTNSKDVTILAELKPAKEVGGDLYDYFQLDDTHVAIVIGDVSGKGTPGAMFMMKTITCIKNFINISESPSEILKKVNKVLCEGNSSQMFVTCFLGILDTKTGEFTYSNAGHNHPVIKRNNKYELLDCYSGFLLGCIEDVPLMDQKIKLESNDIILLYTDGVTEARNEKGEFFGELRLLKELNKKEYTSHVSMFYDLKEEVSKFIGEAEQADDITLLALAYKADEANIKDILVKSKPENIEEIFKVIKEGTKEDELSSKITNELTIIADEIYSNIAKFAYNGDIGDVYFRYEYNRVKKVITLIFIDRGVKFNQTEVNRESITGEEKKLEEGGLGILMVKNLASSFSYDRLNDKNVLVIKYNINK